MTCSTVPPFWRKRTKPASPVGSGPWSRILWYSPPTRTPSPSGESMMAAATWAWLMAPLLRALRNDPALLGSLRSPARFSTSLNRMATKAALLPRLFDVSNVPAGRLSRRSLSPRLPWLPPPRSMPSVGPPASSTLTASWLS